MKTNPNEQNPLNASGHNNAASSDIKPRSKYEAVLHLTLSNRASVIIAAESLVEAEAKADDIRLYEVNDWSSFNVDLRVASVEPLEERGSDE